MDLVIALLNSPRYRSAAWVRDHVAGYEAGQDDTAADDAFSRMFERDKQELRDLGVPIETDPDGSGYRIRAGEFALPPLSFTPAESAALAIAARLWETTVLRDAESSAIRKVRDAAGDGDTPEDPEAALQVRVRTVEPAFAGLLAALRARRAVRFAYRGVADTAPASRTVAPWGMTNYRGAWYLAGFDIDRDAPRTYRLSRIDGEVAAVGRAGAVSVPGDFDITTAVQRGIEDSVSAAALLRVRVGTGAGLRRGAEVLATDRAGYDEIRLPMSSVIDIARQIAAQGADAIAVDPPELRAAVRRLLAGAS